MKTRFLFTILVIMILLAGCQGTNATQSAGLTQVIAFGDGFLDNGACYKYWQESVAQGVTNPEELKTWEANWENHVTNGPLAAEVLAERLKVDLKDYAVCAALSGQDNYNFDMPVLNNTGLLGQIDKFEAELNGQKADPGAIYLIETGAVDVFPVKNPDLKDKPIDTKADEVIANLTMAITRLAKLGAKQVMVWNTADLLPNLPLTNMVGLASQGEVFQQRIDSLLPGELEALAKQLNIKIIPFDYNALNAEIHSDPAKYGLTNLTGWCISSSRVACQAPDEYFFWDDAELSARANEIVAEAMAEQLSK